jgi:autotransporter-associated beta strand protein
MPTIHISSTGVGSPAIAGSGATASVNGIILQSILLNDGGFDYSTPTISLTGGGGSGATASISSTPSWTLNSNRGVQLTANGGTLSQTNGTTFTIGGIISSTGSGTLTKSGRGTLVVSGANTYTGGTIASDGLLAVTGAAATLGTGNVTVQDSGIGAGAGLLIQSGVANAISDTAILSLAGGGTLNVADAGFAALEAGINERIGGLVLGGIAQITGLTYGSTTSSALVQSDEFFSLSGILSVGLLGDFNNDNSVDAADYVAWQKSPGTFGGSGGYDLWRANFGNTFPGAGSSLDGGAVPEPSSLVLLLLGIAAMAGRRRER